MRTINKLLLLLMMILPLGFSACSDDDDNNILPKEEIPELTLGKESIDVEVEKTATIEISKGGGEYSAFSSNPDIISVELNDKTLTIQAVAKGKASVIISDKNSQYKELAVVAFYKEIVLGKENVEVKMPLGHGKTINIPILKGNGGYEVSTESDILTASVANNEVVIKAIKEGEATVVLTDSYGLTLTIPVKITTTTIPYDEEELTVIMDDELIRYEFNGENIDNHQYWNYMNTTEGDMNLYGWDYWSYYYFKVYFPGDRSVGEKEGSKLLIKLDWDNSGTEEAIKFEIIKNDGTKIWAVYSYVKDDVLNFGHFCQNINP